jgi:hypothetical protein
LIRLTARKSELQRRIVLGRTQCAALATEALRPVAWLDRLLMLGRRVAPLVALPFGLVIARRAFRQQPFVGTLLRWSPLILRLARV